MLLITFDAAIFVSAILCGVSPLLAAVALCGVTSWLAEIFPFDFDAVNDAVVMLKRIDAWFKIYLVNCLVSKQDYGFISSDAIGCERYADFFYSGGVKALKNEDFKTLNWFRVRVVLVLFELQVFN